MIAQHDNPSLLRDRCPLFPLPLQELAAELGLDDLDFGDMDPDKVDDGPAPPAAEDPPAAAADTDGGGGGGGDTLKDMDQVDDDEALREAMEVYKELAAELGIDDLDFDFDEKEKEQAAAPVDPPAEPEPPAAVDDGAKDGDDDDDDEEEDEETERALREAFEVYR